MLYYNTTLLYDFTTTLLFEHGCKARPAAWAAVLRQPRSNRSAALRHFRGSSALPWLFETVVSSRARRRRRDTLGRPRPPLRSPLGDSRLAPPQAAKYGERVGAQNFSVVDPLQYSQRFQNFIADGIA